MLSRLLAVKSACFTQRTVAYQETFADVEQASNKHLSLFWRQGIARRSAQEITSSYALAVENDRDKKHIIYWSDNCTDQNKNWYLYSTLVLLVNSDHVRMNGITLK